MSAERSTKLIQINYKIVILIIGFAILLQVYLYVYHEDKNQLDFTDILYSLGTLICGIFGLLVSNRYRGSAIFGRTYLALGLGFLALFVGDMVWNYYEIVVGIHPYPSFADLFYMLFSPLAIYHLLTNIRFFKKKISTQTKIVLLSAIMTIVAVYSFIIYDEASGFDIEFYFGLYYVIASAIILSLAVYGAIIFQHSILGSAWLLLAIGIFIYTISEFWYYYLESLHLYTGYHPVNTLWLISFALMSYALYKHQKTI